MMKRLTGHDDGEINRILSQEDEILPSSGFAASVMDAVRREAVALPPIPFPWKRAMPGLVAGGVALALLVAAVVVAFSQFGGAPRAPQLSPPSGSALALLFQGSLHSAATWTAVALLITFVSVKLSMRLASGKE
jgi:hypothetical protein